MSYAQALVAEARPHMLAAKARAILQKEASKGCLPTIYPQPVALEPTFAPLLNPEALLVAANAPDSPDAVPEHLPALEDTLRLEVWISPKQDFDWKRCELFLKQLQRVKSRILLEIAGNQESISLTVGCHKSDYPIVAAAFNGQFEHCEFLVLPESSLAGMCLAQWENAVFFDYYAPPPYSHLLSRPDEFRYSPYETLLAAMMYIEAPAAGIYQTVFQPVSSAHDWHRNVEFLLDIEFGMKLHGGLQLAQRHAQQAPSGDLRQMAGELETKAHSDKPFFAVAIRVAIVGQDRHAHEFLQSLATFTALFQHGGRPLDYLCESDYKKVLPAKALQDMFLRGATYRPGCLFNSWELAGLAHFPNVAMLEERQVPMGLLSMLPRVPEALAQGTCIGMRDHAGTPVPVHVNPRLRVRHTHCIGTWDMGKSTLIENMILQDIEQGDGVAVIDPHGDLIERLPLLLSTDCVGRTIYFNPGDEFIPLWNPLIIGAGQDPGRVADDLVGAIKSSVSGWGDRLEHLLRNAFCALLQRPGSTLRDVAVLLKFKSAASERLRKDLLPYLDDGLVKQFWEVDYARYKADEITAAQHKLSKLLTSGGVSLMLSQPESRIDFRQIMDDGMVFLANLSALGSEAREIIGRLFLSLLHQTALTRCDTPIEARRPFHIYCDEAHRFITDALEDVLAECRKFAVSLTFAHHYFGQFSQRTKDALGGVGTTIIFRVDAKDAAFLTKNLMGKVTVEDIIGLEEHEGIARIGTEVVRITTLPPRRVSGSNIAKELLEESRRRYCLPKEVVRERIRRRYGGSAYAATLSPPSNDGPVEEFVYDEF